MYLLSERFNHGEGRYVRHEFHQRKAIKFLLLTIAKRNSQNIIIPYTNISLVCGDVAYLN